MPRLVVESGADKGMVYPLGQGSITAGRSANNAIQVIDRQTSRSHAKFIFDGVRAVVRDLNSKNGTFINGERIDGESTMHSGDRIRVGETILLFERDPHDSAIDDLAASVRLIPGGPEGSEKGHLRAGLDESSWTSGRTIRKGVKNATERLKILYQATGALRSTQDQDSLLETIMQSLFSLLQPDRAFLMAADPESGEIRPAMARFADTAGGGEIAVSETIINRCLTERVALLVDDALADMRFRASESVIIQNVRSAICSPMICQDEVLGVLYVDTQDEKAVYDQDDLELATGLANQAAMAMLNLRLQKQMIERRALEREMEIAKDIQMRLLPRKIPAIPNFDISGMSLPAAKVGGDYYDVIAMPDGRVAVAVADVSGKGVPAAILIAAVRSALQAEASRQDASVAEILERLNRLVYRDTARNMFVTMVYGILNPDNSVFEYANAGHPFPLLFAPDGKLTQLETGGCFLGINEDSSYVRGYAKVQPGGTLVIYSDGVTDTLSENGDLFGRDRLVDLIHANRNLRARELRELIYQETLVFRGDEEQFDDFTLLVIRHTGGS